MKFRKRPVVIEAIRWTGVEVDAILGLGSTVAMFRRGKGAGSETELVIETLEGEMRANLGDWIIKGVRGEIYPCKPDIFDLTYEPVAAPVLVEVR